MNKPTVHLIHGYNVDDGGENTTDMAIPFLSGFNYIDHDDKIGKLNLLHLRRRNDEIAADILPTIKEGDIIIAHSNGCLISHMLVDMGAPVSVVICVQPALRRCIKWREDVHVLCIFNESDKVVSLGLAWSWLVSKINIFRPSHQWGAAGRFGFTSGQENVENWDSDVRPIRTKGHSTFWKKKHVDYWMPKVIEWIEGKLWEDERRVPRFA